MSAFPAYPNKGRTIREYDLAAAQDFLQGAVLVLTAGEVSEAGADPAEVLGIALHDAGADPNPTKILVSVARSKSTFIMQPNVGETFAQTDEGVSYGVVEDADGIWVVDKSDTTNLVVVVERVLIDPDDPSDERNQAEVSFLPAVRQFD